MSTLTSAITGPGDAPGLRLAGTVAGAPPAYVAGRNRLHALRERRRVRRLLRDIHEGKWRRVLIDLQTSQYAWPRLQRHSGRIAELLTKVNLVRLAWTMHATVLVGSMPQISVPEQFADHREALAAMERRNALDGLLHSVARKMNVEAEAALRVDLWGDSVALHLEDNERTLPVGPDGPDGQPTVWERRWVVERRAASDRRRVTRYLRVERHRVIGGRAVVEQEAYLTERRDVLVGLDELRRVELAAAGVDGLDELTETAATSPLITRFVADYFDGEPQFAIQENDLDLIDTVCAAMTRLSRAHAIHARPKVRIPEAMIDKRTGEVDLTADAILDPEKQFEYVVAEARLTEMLEFMDRMTTHLLTVLEISPALIGTKLGGGATPDSYDKLRLESTNTLSRARRAATYFGPSLERTLTTAAEVDTALPLRGYAVGPVSVRMRPELPKDQRETVREVAEARGAGLLDESGALATLYGPEEAERVAAALGGERRRKARERRIGDVEAERERQAFPLVTRLSGEQMKVLLELAKSVQRGDVSEDMALGMLVGLGFGEEVARRMVAEQAGLGRRAERRLLQGVL